MTLRRPALLMVACIACAGIAGTWAVPLRLTVQELEQAYLGRQSRFLLTLVNEHRQRTTVRLKPVPPLAFQGELDSQVTRLGANVATRHEFTQTARLLGAHKWPDQPIEVRGPLGFADWIRWVPALDHGDAGQLVSRVEPDILESSRERVALDRVGSRAVARRSMSGSEFRSLRAYASGDPPASIYWKATAKTGRLMVRESETDQQLMLLFLIDAGIRSALQVGALDTLSHAVNLAARMAEFADASGDRYGVVAFAEQPFTQLAPGRGPAQLVRTRNALGELSPGVVESNPLAATLAAKHLLSQRALVLLVTNLDDPDAAGQLLQATLMLRPQHLPMIISVEDQAILESAGAQATSTAELFSTLAAQEYRRVTRRTVAQLERMGAVVVRSPPETLEKSVFARYRALRSQQRV